MLVSELLAGLTTKLAGLGLAAKATLGLGIASVAVTGAGAANVLPDPAQHAVASVVNAVSPLELPDPDLSVDLDVKSKVPDPGSLLPGGQGDDSGEEEGENEGVGPQGNHGACVSAIAKNKDEGTTGREHGEAVSTMARSDCGKEDGGPSLAGADSTTTTTSTTLDGEDDETVTDEPDDGNKGKGRSGESNASRSENRGPGSDSGPGNSGK